MLQTSNHDLFILHFYLPDVCSPIWMVISIRQYLLVGVKLKTLQDLVQDKRRLVYIVDQNNFLVLWLKLKSFYNTVGFWRHLDTDRNVHLHVDFTQGMYEHAMEVLHNRRFLSLSEV